MGVKIFGDSVFRSMRESAAAGALSPEGEGPGGGGAGSRGPGSEGAGSKAPASLPPNIPGLTDRERDILRLLAQGMDNREIARALYPVSYTHLDVYKRQDDQPLVYQIFEAHGAVRGSGGRV